jgi:hypothetical protein
MAFCRTHNRLLGPALRGKILEIPVITTILFRAATTLIGWYNQLVKDPDDMLYVEDMRSRYQ